MSGFTGLKSYGLILWSFFVFFLSLFTACCHWECSCWMRFWENCFCTPYSCNLTDISLVKMAWGEHCVWSSAGSSSLSARVPGAAVDRLILMIVGKSGAAALLIKAQAEWKMTLGELFPWVEHSTSTEAHCGPAIQAYLLDELQEVFVAVRHVYGKLLFIIDASCLV